MNENKKISLSTKIKKSDLLSSLLFTFMPEIEAGILTIVTMVIIGIIDKIFGTDFLNSFNISEVLVVVALTIISFIVWFLRGENKEQAKPTIILTSYILSIFTFISAVLSFLESIDALDFGSFIKKLILLFFLSCATNKLIIDYLKFVNFDFES